MRSRSARFQILSRSLRGQRRGASIRGEIALAAVVVTVYATVVGMSVFSLFGGHGTPDLLRLGANQETPAGNVAQVLGAQAEATSVAPALVETPVRTPDATTAPAETRPHVETAAPEPSTAAQPATTTTLPVASVSGQHVVRSGDTLSQLGVLYHVDVGALKLINGLGSDLIYAGQSLIVPRPVEASEISVPRLGEGSPEQ